MRSRGRMLALACYLLASIALICGWRLFWFLTDDAYIAFRYVHNAALGRGLVWNPAPFLPVEGYTSFSWVMLLLGVQRTLGIEPDVASNWLGLGLGLVELALVVRVLFELELPAAWRRARLGLVLLVLAGLLTNRTFLTWLSSGLETPLFNTLLTGWLVALVSAWPAEREHEQRRLWLVSTLAGLLGLTRPDGVPFAAVTLGLVVMRARGRGDARVLLTALPLLVIPLHVAWRLSFYGALWPNTYYAKYSNAWPESGLRYLGSFVLEYGLYGWLLLIAVWLWRRRKTQLSLGSLKVWEGLLSSPRVVAWTAVTCHLAAITLLIGGDHFEFRPYSYIVPWLWIGLLKLAASITNRPGRAAGLLAAAWLISLPIPWVHFYETRNIYPRERTHFLHFRVAPLLPQPLRAVASLWDDWQGWLIGHYVCMRHQEHKAFLIHQFQFWEDRAHGAALPWRDHDVMFATAVGVPGWVFPNVAIIDLLGLNDYVTARTRDDESTFQRMAHDRWPPRGYVGCFEPNVDGFRASFAVKPRPLSDADIQACEAHFRAALRSR